MRLELNEPARYLVDEMSGDNGCRFTVMHGQAHELNELCSSPAVRALTPDELDTLASGEESEARAIAARHPDIERVYALLNDIFDQPVDVD